MTHRAAAPGFLEATPLDDEAGTSCLAVVSSKHRRLYACYRASMHACPRARNSHPHTLVNVRVLVQALFDYNAVETDELAFRSGERMVRTHGFRPPSMVESLAFGAQWEVLPTRAKRTIPSCPHTGRVRVARGGLARVRAWRSYRHGTRQLRPPSPERRSQQT